MTEYLVIDLQKHSAAQFTFHGLSYNLSPDEVTRLIENGVLLACETEKSLYPLSPDEMIRLIGTTDILFQEQKPFYHGYGCHRCRRSFWSDKLPATCPHCLTNTWNTFTLLYCCECHALFEYYWHLIDEAHPYDRFPRCPACKSERWCPAENERLKSLPSKEEIQAQAEAKRQMEVQAYKRIMELRKQQEWKKMGLGTGSSRSPQDPLVARLEKEEPKTQEGGAAILEAEAFYKSTEGKSTWLNKGSRPVEHLKSQPSTPASPSPAPEPESPVPVSQSSIPAAQPPASAPRRGILSILRDWFGHRRL